ncbi:MAG: glucosaminidase domain-containing protein [Bacteroidales bacterium]|nr:glucosaminidase domain-containing protein [Bacteroidales bacterium]
MKRILLLFAAVWLSLGAGVNPRLAYIDQYSALAVLEMQRTGVPASITLAQGMLESGAGLSPLATKANNHFGLKCHGDWTGERFYYDDETPDECFRMYRTVEDSFRAHSDFLRGRERYASLFELDPTDYKGWARGLRRAGYATDPSYASKLITLIEDFQLYRFDTMTEDDLSLAGEPAQADGEEAFASAKPSRPDPAPEALDETVSLPAFQESVSLSLARPMYEMNGVRYVRVVEGDTWASLAADNRLSLRQILRFNDLTEPIALEPGLMVYLARKKAEAEPGYGLYEVDQEGLTLWDVSQMFGIQLKKLRLYNIFRGEAPLEIGDTVILRKL